MIAIDLFAGLGGFSNKPAADGPKYKALGNSFAVPVVRWIGERVKRACDSKQQREAA